LREVNRSNNREIAGKMLRMDVDCMEM
jgi:hypothetical protein